MMLDCGSYLTFYDQTLEIYLTTNRTNFHESEAASPERVIVAFIRAHPCHPWLKSSAFRLKTPMKEPLPYYGGIFQQ